MAANQLIVLKQISVLEAGTTNIAKDGAFLLCFVVLVANHRKWATGCYSEMQVHGLTDVLMQKVVCVFAVLADVPDGQDDANAMLNAITGDALQGLGQCLANYPNVHLPQSSSYVWVNSDEHICNVYTCEHCGRIGTASNRENMVFGLPEGAIKKEVFMCDECWHTANIHE